MNLCIRKLSGPDCCVLLKNNNTTIIYDDEIAKYLSIKYNKYINILKEHNAYYDPNSGYNFKSITDLESVIKTLEPYLILKKLTE